MSSTTTAPAADAVAALAEQVARQDERLGRIEATLRALARLPENPPAAPAALVDTKPAASAPTPLTLPWPVRLPPVDHPTPLPAAADAGLWAAVEGFADALVGVDDGGLVRVWNPRAARLFGWSAAEVLGRPPPFLPDDRRDEHAAMLRADPGVMPARNLATARRRKDGSCVDLRVWASPSPAGGVLFTFRPAPPPADAPDPLPPAAAAPEPEPTAPAPVTQGFITLGRAAAGVAHDLNNLLAAVQGFADLLAEHVPPGDPRRHLVDGLGCATEVASGVTRQLLALACPTPGLPPRADAAAVVGRVERVVRAVAGARVKLAVTAAADLPPARVTPAELAQVVLNLCLNARDAMPDGGTLTVRAAAQAAGPDRPGWPAGVPAGEFVVLTVADTGAGMDAATRARVFDAGFTTKAGGCGIGLMTVRDILARVGGHVEVESAPGWGTQVRVYFPRG